MQLTVAGATTSVPAFRVMDDSKRIALVDAIAGELAPMSDSFIQGDEVVFSMHTHIAIAYCA